jgi:uncharacterized membrane-anchored protein
MGHLIRRLALAALLACCAMGAQAQDEAAATGASGATEAVDPQQQAFLEKLRKLDWVRGPASVSVAGNAKLQIPEGYVFLQPGETTKFLELNQNLGDGNEVMVAPEDLRWQAYLEFAEEGYVKDTDEIDGAALLKDLKDSTDAANPERRKRGWPDLRVLDWAVPPAYNKQTRRLEWATLLESEGDRSANFYTKILGRRGYTSVQMVATSDELPVAQAALNEVLGGYAFGAGDTYADFKPGDKVAAYGLAALVAGGAAAVATKKGFFAALAGFFAAAWKLIVAAAVAAGAWLRSLFNKKKQT